MLHRWLWMSSQADEPTEGRLWRWTGRDTSWHAGTRRWEIRWGGRWLLLLTSDVRHKRMTLHKTTVIKTVVPDPPGEIAHSQSNSGEMYEVRGGEGGKGVVVEEEGGFVKWNKGHAHVNCCQHSVRPHDRYPAGQMKSYGHFWEPSVTQLLLWWLQGEKIQNWITYCFSTFYYRKSFGKWGDSLSWLELSEKTDTALLSVLKRDKAICFINYCNCRYI